MAPSLKDWVVLVFAAGFGVSKVKALRYPDGACKILSTGEQEESVSLFIRKLT